MTSLPTAGAFMYLLWMPGKIGRHAVVLQSRVCGTASAEVEGVSQTYDRVLHLTLQTKAE